MDEVIVHTSPSFAYDPESHVRVVYVDPQLEPVAQQGHELMELRVDEEQRRGITLVSEREKKVSAGGRRRKGRKKQGYVKRF